MPGKKTDDPIPSIPRKSIQKWIWMEDPFLGGIFWLLNVPSTSMAFFVLAKRLPGKPRRLQDLLDKRVLKLRWQWKLSISRKYIFNWFNFQASILVF